MTFSLGIQITVPADVLVQELDGESVLLNLKSGLYFGLDNMGTRFWSHLTSSRSIELAYDALLAEYEVDADKLRQDLQEFVEKLASLGLVEVHEK